MTKKSHNKYMGKTQNVSERGIFGNSSSPEARYIENHVQLSEYVNALRTLNLSIVLTSGTFDLLHIGHARYLEEAKKYGDILIVGVDSDEKVRLRKGPERPVVPSNERINMLAHLRSVDIITIKKSGEPRWELIKLINPDTLIVTKETYDNETINKLSKICGHVIILEPQATTSTSAQIRRLQVGWSSKIINPVEELLVQHNAKTELKTAIGKILTGRNNE
jgi:D-beta-D-heptose 7-phosphate kinase/D-beta-D-heptose 1-phosphate adenosyltransferase